MNKQQSGLGLGVGIAIGVIIGIILDNIAIGIGIGVALGLAGGSWAWTRKDQAANDDSPPSAGNRS